MAFLLKIDFKLFY